MINNPRVVTPPAVPRRISLSRPILALSDEIVVGVAYEKNMFIMIICHSRLCQQQGSGAGRDQASCFFVVMQGRMLK